LKGFQPQAKEDPSDAKEEDAELYNLQPFLEKGKKEKGQVPSLKKRKKKRNN
jgi:hypothetical protein